MAHSQALAYRRSFAHEDHMQQVCECGHFRILISEVLV